LSKRPDENTTLRAEADGRLIRAQLPEVPAQSAKVLQHELQLHQIEIAPNALIKMHGRHTYRY